MFGNIPRGPVPPDDDDGPRAGWYRADMSPAMRNHLILVMKKQTKSPINDVVLEALELAEHINTVYTPPVDWDRLERWAQRGYDLADQAFDGFDGKNDPPKDEAKKAC